MRSEVVATGTRGNYVLMATTSGWCHPEVLFLFRTQELIFFWLYKNLYYVTIPVYIYFFSFYDFTNKCFFLRIYQLYIIKEYHRNLQYLCDQTIFHYSLPFVN